MKLKKAAIWGIAVVLLAGGIAAGADAVDFRLVNLCTRDDIFAESFEKLVLLAQTKKG